MSCWTRVVALMDSVLMLVLILLKPGAAAAPGTSNFSSHVEGQVGDNVTLQCACDSVNLENLTIEWKRTGTKQLVHVRRHGKDAPQLQGSQFRQRTALNKDDLTRGVITLQLSSVRLSDSGEYACNVPKDQDCGCSVTLNVTNHQQINIRPSTRSPEDVETTESEAKNTVITSVGLVVGACVVGACVVGVVFKWRTIHSCWTSIRQAPASDDANSQTEMETLKTSAEGDQNHNDPGHNKQEVVLSEKRRLLRPASASSVSSASTAQTEAQ